MDKKEIAEIKKSLKTENTSIDFIVTAFVKHDKDTTSVMAMHKNRLLTMDDSEIHQYLDNGKSVLSGKVEKNLLGIDFPTEEFETGGCQDRLYTLLKSNLNDDAITEEFIEFLASNYDTAENLMIQLAHGVYDVPTKAKDKTNTGESETVYAYIICSVCPMKTEKKGIFYNPETDKFELLDQKLIADKPETGFLFPAFNDRATDLNQLLFYTKKPDKIHPEFIAALTGGKAPLPADFQKKIFENIIAEIAKDTDFEDTKNIHGEVRTRIDTRHMNEENTHITKADIKDIIDSSIGNISETTFNDAYDKLMADYDDTALSLENIIDTNKFDISVPDIQIKVKPDKTENIEQKIVDGRKCFIIPVSGNVEVNGIQIAKA